MFVLPERDKTERYRSGRNGGASKASCRVTGTGVRIPPSPPHFAHASRELRPGTKAAASPGRPGRARENEAIQYTVSRQGTISELNVGAARLTDPVVECPACRVAMVWTRYATHAAVYLCPCCGHALISPLPATPARSDAPEKN